MEAAHPHATSPSYRSAVSSPPYSLPVVLSSKDPGWWVPAGASLSVWDPGKRHVRTATGFCRVFAHAPCAGCVSAALSHL